LAYAFRDKCGLSPIYSDYQQKEKERMRSTNMRKVVVGLCGPICVGGMLMGVSTAAVADHHAYDGKIELQEKAAPEQTCVLRILDLRSIADAGEIDNVTYLSMNWCEGNVKCSEFKKQPRFTLDAAAPKECQQGNKGYFVCEFNAPTDITLEYEQRGQKITMDSKFTNSDLKIGYGKARQQAQLSQSSLIITVKTNDDCPSN